MDTMGHHQERLVHFYMFLPVYTASNFTGVTMRCCAGLHSTTQSHYYIRNPSNKTFAIRTNLEFVNWPVLHIVLIDLWMTSRLAHSKFVLSTNVFLFHVWGPKPSSAQVRLLEKSFEKCLPVYSITCENYNYTGGVTATFAKWPQRTTTLVYLYSNFKISQKMCRIFSWTTILLCNIWTEQSPGWWGPTYRFKRISGDMGAWPTWWLSSRMWIWTPIGSTENTCIASLTKDVYNPTRWKALNLHHPSPFRDISLLPDSTFSPFEGISHSNGTSSIPLLSSCTPWGCHILFLRFCTLWHHCGGPLGNSDPKPWKCVMSSLFYPNDYGKSDWCRSFFQHTPFQ